MELRQESLFADETKGGIEVIYSKFIDRGGWITRPCSVASTI